MTFVRAFLFADMCFGRKVLLIPIEHVKHITKSLCNGLNMWVHVFDCIRSKQEVLNRRNIFEHFNKAKLLLGVSVVT